MLSHVERDGGAYEQEYFRGKPKGNVKSRRFKKNRQLRKLLTQTRKFFQKIEYDPKRILNHLRQQAYLTKGVRIVFKMKELRGRSPATLFILKEELARM